MAALDFPDSPSVGDIYDKWKWDGTRWTIAPGAVKGAVAYAQVTASQSITPANTAVALGGLSVVFTPAIGRRYRITGKALFIGTGTPGAELDIMINGTRANLGSAVKLDAAYYSSVISEHVFVSGAASALTVSLTAIGLGAAVSMGASSDYPAFILVEDITLEAGISGGSGGSAPAGGYTHIRDTVPPTPTAGDTWYDTSTGFSWLYYNDGNSSQWLQTAPGSASPPVPSYCNVAFLSANIAVTTQTTLGFEPTSRRHVSPASDYTVNNAGTIVVTRGGIYRLGWSFTINLLVAAAGAYLHGMVNVGAQGGIYEMLSPFFTASNYITLGGTGVTRMVAGEQISVTMATQGTGANAASTRAGCSLNVQRIDD